MAIGHHGPLAMSHKLSGYDILEIHQNIQLLENII